MNHPSLFFVRSVPFFTEPGFTLQRTLQALALQRADLRRYRYLQGVPPSQLPEMHVFAIADGWAKPGALRRQFCCSTRSGTHG